jgi:hypothetical protein
MAKDQNNSNNNKSKKCSIAIVGAGFAGLSLANLLADNATYHYEVFEARSDNDDLSSYYNAEVRLPCLNQQTLRDRLKIKLNLQENSSCLMSRAEILRELGRGVVETIQFNCQITDIQEKGKGCYWLTDSQGKQHGPFSIIVVADGVRSPFRRLHFVYCIGDARWVRDVFYDFGRTRIQQGADIAMRDALALEQMLSSGNNHGDEEIRKERFQPRKRSIEFLMVCLAALIWAWLVQQR